MLMLMRRQTKRVEEGEEEKSRIRIYYSFIQDIQKRVEGGIGWKWMDGRLFVYSFVIHERRTVSGTDRMAQKKRRGEERREGEGSRSWS